MVNKVEITDYYELIALHSALMAARFTRNPIKPEIPGSPFLADIACRTAETLDALEIERGKPERVGWRREITPGGEVWHIAARNAAHYPEVWNKWSAEQKTKSAKIYLSPFSFSEATLNAFIDQVDDYANRSGKLEGLLWFPSTELFNDKSVENGLTFAIGKTHVDTSTTVSAQSDSLYRIPYNHYVVSQLEPKVFIWEHIRSDYPIVLTKAIDFPDQIVGAVSIVIDTKQTVWDNASTYQLQLEHLTNIAFTAHEMNIPLLFVCIRLSDERSSTNTLLGDLLQLPSITAVDYDATNPSDFRQEFIRFLKRDK